MEWLKELLEKNGVDGEAVQKIVAAADDKLKGYIPKHRFDEVNEAKKQLEEQLAERDNQFLQLKKAVGDNEELKKQIEQLQEENKSAKEKYEAELKDLQLSTAVKLYVAGTVHDPDIVLGLLDKSKILLDENGNIKAGLDEQIQALREAKSFLFVQKEQARPQMKGMTPAESREQSTGGIKNPWSEEHFNLTEQGRLLRENPELAAQLKEQAGG